MSNAFFIFNRASRRDLLIQPFVCSQVSDRKNVFSDIQSEIINSGSSYGSRSFCL